MARIVAIAESKGKPKRYWYETDKGACVAFRTEPLVFMEMTNGGEREDTPKFKVFRFKESRRFKF